MPERNKTESGYDNWPIQILVNGTIVAKEIEPRVLLIDFLRTEALLTGPRIGCEEGACGACTVELNGH